MNAMIKQKDINFLVPYQKKAAPPTGGEAPAKKSKKALLILFPSLMAAVFVGLFIVILVFATMEQARADALTAYLASPEIVQAGQQADDANTLLGLLNGQLSDMQGYRAALESYPRFNQKTYDAIQQATGGVIDITALNYNGTDGTLSLSALTSTVGNCPIFVERIKATGLFDDVRYYGYGDDGEGYAFSVNCLMKVEGGE